MSIEIPLNKDEMISLADEVEEFVRLCGKSDSLGRVYAWSKFHRVLIDVLREEEFHSFKFPSPHNPNKIAEQLNHLKGD